MKLKNIISTILILSWSLIGFSQNKISITSVQNTYFKEQSAKWMETYFTNINILGSAKKNVQEKSVYLENILLQFENEDMVVKNDLSPSGKTQKELRISQLLGNIITLFSQNGVSFSMQNLSVSDVFIRKENDFLFLKLTYNRTIKGTNVFNVFVNDTLKVDVYIKYTIENNIIDSKPIIYSLGDYIDNLKSFTKVEINDSPTKINSLELKGNIAEVEDIYKKAQEKSNKLVLQEDSLNRQLVENKELIKKAELEKKKAEKERRKMEIKKLQEENKYYDAYTFGNFVKISPVRVFEGLYQAGIEQRILKTRKNISFEQSFGIYQSEKKPTWSQYPPYAMLSVIKYTDYIKLRGWLSRSELRMYFKDNTLYGPYLALSYTHFNQKYLGLYEIYSGNIGTFNINRIVDSYSLVYGWQMPIFFTRINYEPYLGLGYEFTQYLPDENDIPLNISRYLVTMGIKISVRL